MTYFAAGALAGAFFFFTPKSESSSDSDILNDSSSDRLSGVTGFFGAGGFLKKVKYSTVNS